MIKVLIVDDEQSARNAHRIIVERNFKDLEIVAEASGVNDAIEMIIMHKPDLLLLDIEINGGTGFDVLQNIRPKNMSVIFITAFNDFAIKAFKFSASDYVLKPVDPDDLIGAIQKVVDRQVSGSFESRWELMQYNNQNKQKKLALPTSKGLFMVQVDHIIHCKADSSYTEVYTINGKRAMVSKNLKEYDEVLKEYGFFRIHQSHLVNLQYIVEFSHQDGGIVTMEDGTQIPVARRRKEKLIELLKE